MDELSSWYKTHGLIIPELFKEIEKEVNGYRKKYSRPIPDHKEDEQDISITPRHELAIKLHKVTEELTNLRSNINFKRTTEEKTQDRAELLDLCTLLRNIYDEYERLDASMTQE